MLERLGPMVGKFFCDLVWVGCILAVCLLDRTNGGCGARCNAFKVTEDIAFAYGGFVIVAVGFLVLLYVAQFVSDMIFCRAKSTAWSSSFLNPSV